MTHRNVIRFFSATLVAALALGCTDTPTGAPSNGLIQVSPLSASVKVGTTKQLTATLNGAAAPVTWESNNQAVATVTSDGLVAAVASGRASITAKMVSDPTQIRSASITVP